MTLSNPSASTPSLAAPGEMHDVDGLRLHLIRSGPTLPDPRLPTIVIEAGAGCAAVLYTRLQRMLAKRYVVVSHDRPGLGWSDFDDEPLDGVRQAGRLHALLGSAGIGGPLLFVGHSLGGLLIRAYAGRYPDQVAGMVFLDSSHPRQLDELGDVPLEGFEQSRLALLAQRNGGPPAEEIAIFATWMADMPDVQAQAVAVTRPESVAATILEVKGMRQLVRQVLDAGDLGDRPLAVLWAPAIDTPFPGHDLETLRRLWRGYQAELGRLSTRGRVVAIDGADHMGIALMPPFVDRVSTEIDLVADQIADAGTAPH